VYCQNRREVVLVEHWIGEGAVVCQVVVEEALERMCRGVAAVGCYY